MMKGSPQVDLSIEALFNRRMRSGSLKDTPGMTCRGSYLHVTMSRVDRPEAFKRNDVIT